MREQCLITNGGGPGYRGVEFYDKYVPVCLYI